MKFFLRRSLTALRSLRLCFPALGLALPKVYLLLELCNLTRGVALGLGNVLRAKHPVVQLFMLGFELLHLSVPLMVRGLMSLLKIANVFVLLPDVRPRLLVHRLSCLIKPLPFLQLVGSMQISFPTGPSALMLAAASLDNSSHAFRFSSASASLASLTI